MNKTNAELTSYFKDFFVEYQAQDQVDVVICPQMPSLSYVSTFLPKEAIRL